MLDGCQKSQDAKVLHSELGLTGTHLIRTGKQGRTMTVARAPRTTSALNIAHLGSVTFSRGGQA